MRLAINIVGVILVTSAIWNTMDGRIVAAVALAVAAFAIAFIRHKF
jgi:hypothetical protein